MPKKENLKREPALAAPVASAKEAPAPVPRKERALLSTLIRNLVLGLIALSVLLISGFIAYLMVQSGPQAVKNPTQIFYPVVSVQDVALADVPQMISAEGETSAKRRTRLAVEVGGRVRRVSPQFEIGEILEAGSLLLELEDADYVSALAQAKSTHEEAKLALLMEKARAKQSLREWKQINGSREPGLLTTREPQITSATARIEATQAAIAKAQRDLDRTRIRAPYACRVISKGVQLGAIASPGTEVAEVISTGSVEVILPIPMKELAWLRQDSDSGEPRGEVNIRAQWGGGLQTWVGKIIRSEGIVDRASRTLRIVVELDGENPANTIDSLPPVGLFVKAEIIGQALPQVVRLPRSTVTEKGEVWLLADDRTLFKRPVTVTRQLQNEVFISDGLSEGDRVCLTIPSTPVVGMTVEIKEVKEVEAEKATQATEEIPEGSGSHAPSQETR